MHRGQQCAAPNGLPDAGLGSAEKGASPGLGRGADSLFSVVLCWQNFKICECLVAMPSFQCIGGGAPKGASPGLGGGLNAIFCLISGASSVGKCVAGVKQVWQCSVLLAVWETLRTAPLKTP